MPRPLSYNFEPVQDEKTLRLIFFGDMMGMRGGRVPRVHPALKNLLKNTDLVIGNCEAPVTLTSRSYLFTFQIAKDFVRAFLKELGIIPHRCILSIANNHVGDQGKEGLNLTLKHLEVMGITPIGHYQAGKHPITKIACNGLTLGLVAWTHWLNQNFSRIPPDVWRTQDIGQVIWPDLKKTAGVDCLIGTPHWDYEFQHFPRAETRALAQNLIENGFNILVGHHPHVIQPIERLGSNLCLYSLGNLCGPLTLPYVSWPVRLLALFEVRLLCSGPNRGRLAGYTLHPFVQTVVGNEVYIAPLDETSSALREKIEKRLGLLFQYPKVSTSNEVTLNPSKKHLWSVKDLDFEGELS